EPTIQIESQFSSGDLVVTNTGGYVTGASGRLGLGWAEPPEQMTTGQTYQMTLTPDPTTSKPTDGRSSTSPAPPRRLYGDVDIIPYDFSDNFAVIGYFEEGKGCGFDRCYALKQQPITRVITAGADEFNVSVRLTAYGGLTFGGNGERHATVTWKYVRK
ncbi:MAG TPA: hypothetical protein VHH73_09970, partial [Verrucomicrobiae bacterium]|nr:hypothetical protein [Verrucomicrobiae bacterium]